MKKKGKNKKKHIRRRNSELFRTSSYNVQRQREYEIYIQRKYIRDKYFVKTSTDTGVQVGTCIYLFFIFFFPTNNNRASFFIFSFFFTMYEVFSFCTCRRFKVLRAKIYRRRVESPPYMAVIAIVDLCKTSKEKRRSLRSQLERRKVTWHRPRHVIARSSLSLK